MKNADSYNSMTDSNIRMMRKLMSLVIGSVIAVPMTMSPRLAETPHHVGVVMMLRLTLSSGVDGGVVRRVRQVALVVLVGEGSGVEGLFSGGGGGGGVVSSHLVMHGMVVHELPMVVPISLLRGPSSTTSSVSGSHRVAPGGRGEVVGGIHGQACWRRRIFGYSWLVLMLQSGDFRVRWVVI